MFLARPERAVAYTRPVLPSSASERARAVKKEAEAKKWQKEWQEQKDREKKKSDVSAAAVPMPNWQYVSVVDYIQQPDQDTCGPTSVRNALTNWSVYKTVNEVKPYVGFGYYGPDCGYCTPWSDKIPQSLNTLANTSWYVRTDAPSVSQLWLAFQMNYANAHPIVINIERVSGGYHLYGYNPNTYYGHFVTGVGHFEEATGAGSDQMIYFDPYNRPSDLYGNPYGLQQVSLSNLSTLTRTRGIAW